MSRTTEKKPVRRRWRRNFLLAVVISCALVSLATLWLTDNYLWRFSSRSSNAVPRALIADQLALNYPDPGFVTNLTSALVNAGYQVDYWGPSSNAVDQFRQLPSDGYDLIVIRSHTGSSQSIITTQTYSQKDYAAEQLTGALVPAVVGNGPVYFALTSRFIRDDMMGRFSQSTIIVMGCAALQGSTDLAASFLDKGANYFIGWDGTVSIIHTDTSTVALAQQISNGMTIPEATTAAGNSDPVFGSKLGYVNWNDLVQSRLNNLESAVAIWLVLGGVLVGGPMAVFLAPKLLSTLDNTLGRMRRRKTNRANGSQQKPKRAS